MGSAAISNHPTSADAADLRGEFSELLSGCGVFPLNSRAKISITGSDRVRWLNGMVTNNIRDLAPGRGVYAFQLNPQGHILGDLYAYNRDDSLIVDTDRSQVEKLLATFDHYIIMDDVEVAEITDKMGAIGVAGPGAGAVLHAAGLEVPLLEPLQLVDLKSGGIPLTIVRGDMPGVDWYEIWLRPDQHAHLCDMLRKSGAKPIGVEALELLRIAAGVPRYAQDIREHHLPQETEQARALNFNKGCYIGQEIVERIRSRGAVHRKFIGFEVEGPLPSRGIKLQFEGREIGEITSAATLPLATGDRRVALGYIRREMATPGGKIQAENSTLVVANLPFTGVFRA